MAALKSVDLKMLLVIHRHAHYTTRNCRPTDQTIAKEGGIHLSSVPLARRHLQLFGAVKAWMHRGRWHYSLPKDIDQEVPGVYLEREVRKDKVRKNPAAYRRCRHCGRFESLRENSRHTCRKIPGQVLRKIPGTEDRQKDIEIMAGSAPASANASASPASDQSETTKPASWKEETLKLLHRKDGQA